MCIAIPMRVVSAEGLAAECVCEGKTRRVRTALLGEVAPGEMLLVFRDEAIRRMDEAEAAEVNAALTALSGVMAGDDSEETIRQGFPDLVDAEPELPEHLKALVGKHIL